MIGNKEAEDLAVKKALILLNRILRKEKGIVLKPKIIKEIKEGWRGIKPIETSEVKLNTETKRK